MNATREAHKVILFNNISMVYSGASLNVTLMTLQCALMTLYKHKNICRECNVLVYNINVWLI